MHIPSDRNPQLRVFTVPQLAELAAKEGFPGMSITVLIGGKRVPVTNVTFEHGDVVLDVDQPSRPKTPEEIAHPGNAPFIDYACRRWANGETERVDDREDLFRSFCAGWDAGQSNLITPRS